jgi:hypothetical protein
MLGGKLGITSNPVLPSKVLKPPKTARMVPTFLHQKGLMSATYGNHLGEGEQDGTVIKSSGIEGIGLKEDRGCHQC